MAETTCKKENSKDEMSKVEREVGQIMESFVDHCKSCSFYSELYRKSLQSSDLSE